VTAVDWRDRAACGPSTARLFDPIDIDDRRGDDYGAARHARARAICASCPVRIQCLDDGIDDHASGIRGGELLDHGTPIGTPRRPGRPRKDEGRIVAESARIYREKARAAAWHAARGTGRSIDSYFGPAAPELIAELLEALNPIIARRDEHVERVRELAAAGLTGAEIAVRTGRSRSAIEMLRLRHGIPSGRAARRERSAS
jgi:WhiB family transcriptional regulator, redox-sensing transcriptional regulator